MLCAIGMGFQSCLKESMNNEAVLVGKIDKIERIATPPCDFSNYFEINSNVNPSESYSSPFVTYEYILNKDRIVVNQNGEYSFVFCHKERFTPNYLSSLEKEMIIDLASPSSDYECHVRINNMYTMFEAQSGKIYIRLNDDGRTEVDWCDIRFSGGFSSKGGFTW